MATLKSIREKTGFEQRYAVYKECRKMLDLLPEETRPLVAQDLLDEASAEFLTKAADPRQTEIEGA